MIENLGKIKVPNKLIELADSIKTQNYKVNTPAKFQKHFNFDKEGLEFTKSLSKHLNCKEDKLNWVYFSASLGAEPHIDMLDEKEYGTLTYVIPIILPEGKNILTVEKTKKELELFNIYQFNHQKLHSMEVSDYTGCVVIMASIMS